jgi:general secretion pathway protein D
MTKIAKKRFFFGFLVLSLAFINGCISSEKPIKVIKQPVKKEREKNKFKELKKKDRERIKWLQKPIDEKILVEYRKKEKREKYLMNFDDIEISKFIETMMTGVFKFNYFITSPAKDLKTKITIRMSEDLPGGKLFGLFQKVLEINKISVEKEANTYIFDVLKKGTFTIKGPIIFGRTLPEHLPVSESDEVTFLTPFYNITPDILQAVIGKKLSAGLLLIPIKQSNILIINGKYEEVKYVLSIIDLIDRVQFKDKAVIMLTPKYWDVNDFYEKIKELLSAEGISWKNVETARSLVFIPIENLNSLLVISPVKEWIERIIYWLNKLDIPEAAGEAKKVFVYRLRNIEVDSVIEVLRQYQEGDGISTPTQTPRAYEDPDVKSPDSGSPTSQMQTFRKKVLSKNSVSAVPIKETNSVVIIGTPIEYKKYLAILKKIDIPRNQVFVEVIIGEISIDSSTQLGIEFWLNRYLYKNEFGTKGGLGVFKDTGTSGGIAIPSGSNLFLKGVLKGTQYEILMNALLTYSKINIISTPKLTVLENSEAEISVGSDVPVISGQSGGGALFKARTREIKIKIIISIIHIDRYLILKQELF